MAKGSCGISKWQWQNGKALALSCEGKEFESSYCHWH